MPKRQNRPRHILGELCALALVANLIASCGGGSGGTSSGSTNGGGPNRDHLKSALSAAIEGCWKTSGGNVWGAYRQDVFFEGATLNSAGECAINLVTAPVDPGTATIQTFHTSTNAAKGAKEESTVTHFLAVYQGGAYVLTVRQGSRAEFAQAAQHAAESNGMKRVTGS